MRGPIREILIAQTILHLKHGETMHIVCATREDAERTYNHVVKIVKSQELDS